MENKEPSNPKKTKAEAEGGQPAKASSGEGLPPQTAASNSTAVAGAAAGNAAAIRGTSSAPSGVSGGHSAGAVSKTPGSASRPGSASGGHGSSGSSNSSQPNRSPSHGQAQANRQHARNASAGAVGNGGSGAPATTSSPASSSSSSSSTSSSCANPNHVTGRTRGHHGHNHHPHRERERHRERQSAGVASDAVHKQLQPLGSPELVWDAKPSPAPVPSASASASASVPPSASAYAAVAVSAASNDLLEDLPSNAVVRNALSCEDLAGSGPASISSTSSGGSTRSNGGDHGPANPVANGPPPLPLLLPQQREGNAQRPPIPEAAPPGLGGGDRLENAVPYNWQASRATLKERLAFIFTNEIMADVHFRVGKEPHLQRIPAHKFVLAIGSAVFDAMFNGGMATTSDDIDLPDVEPAAFLSLLRFLYTDEVQIGPEIVMTTLYTAKKYAVPALERACVEFLKRNLSSDNAFMLLTQARLFDEPQLAALCLETIDKNTTEALSAEGFGDVDLDTLCVVLERDTLGIRESKLFTAVCRWAEFECVRQAVQVSAENKRRVLSRALSLIRFPLMTVEEFAMGAAQSKILSDREVVDLFLHFTVNPKPSVGFLDTPRCCLTGKEQVVSRFCQIESRWGYSGTSDRIRFMVNRRIFVVGFGLYGSIHGPAEYAVNIQVIHTDSGKVCGQNDTSFQCDGSNSTFRVMFKEPVEILPNTSFTACATLKGPDSYYGTKGMRKVTHESLASGKVTFQFTYAAGNNNGTSVEDGQLPEIIFYT